ncbi:putative quinol monooxygenase [Nocardia sp. NPDC088792]|uniref:putative quinol monooxygenase n=1 Tax=Nocardia sp. NPDC088792 TaxID=3364332 RepID=UPI0037FE06A5
MTQVALLTRIKVQPGKTEAFLAAFQEVFTQAEKEPGTLLYVLNRSTDDPTLFWVTELYASEEALATHRTSEAMDAARTAFPTSSRNRNTLSAHPSPPKAFRPRK